MAATVGSTYQAIRTAHTAGRPPNTDPQRATETFATYKIRMAGNELPPDIDADESDADYLVRLAGYTPAPLLENISASYALYAGSEIAPSATSSYANKALIATTAQGLPVGTYAVTASWASKALVADGLNVLAGWSSKIIVQSSSMTYYTASIVGGLMITMSADLI